MRNGLFKSANIAGVRAFGWQLDYRWTKWLPLDFGDGNYRWHVLPLGPLGNVTLGKILRVPTAPLGQPTEKEVLDHLAKRFPGLNVNAVQPDGSDHDGERMVILLNSNAKMTRGKAAAQAVHAALTLIGAHHHGPVIVLGGKPSEIEDMPIKIRDSGRTEVDPGTLTAGAKFAPAEGDR